MGADGREAREETIRGGRRGGPETEGRGGPGNSLVNTPKGEKEEFYTATFAEQGEDGSRRLRGKMLFLDL